VGGWVGGRGRYTSHADTQDSCRHKEALPGTRRSALQATVSEQRYACARGDIRSLPLPPLPCPFSPSAVLRLQVEMLLRFGAYAIMEDDDSAAEAFMDADIDKILSAADTVEYEEAPPEGEVRVAVVEIGVVWWLRCGFLPRQVFCMRSLHPMQTDVADRLVGTLLCYGRSVFTVRLCWVQEGAGAEDAEAGGGSSSRPAMPKMSFNKATFATEGSDQVWCTCSAAAIVFAFL
jgi:hypothetical protein